MISLVIIINGTGFFRVTLFSSVSFTQAVFFLNYALQDGMEILFLIKNLLIDNISFIGSLGARTLCILINFHN